MIHKTIFLVPTAYRTTEYVKGPEILCKTERITFSLNLLHPLLSPG